jgi:GTPase SAR1 family protein
MNLFPAYAAAGLSFCNRDQERALLKQHIENNIHTVVVAPRRYGKTSLVERVLHELKEPFARIDFLVDTCVEDVRNNLMHKVGELLYSVLPKTEKAKQKLLALFSSLYPEIVLSVTDPRVIFRPRVEEQQPTQTIVDLLMALNAAAKASNKKLVIFIDEFQQIATLGDQGIEASIRHAMQYSSHVCYIFSGSNRHLLITMFNDRNRPFYKSCEMLRLNRISTDSYREFIKKAANKKWKVDLSDAVIDEILKLSERHAYYVNAVCRHFWLQDSPPTIGAVSKYWGQYVLSNRQVIAAEIGGLSTNQKRLLKQLALSPVKQPHSSDFCYKLRLSQASVKAALTVLQEKDFVYKNDNGFYRLVDPAIRHHILQVIA